MGHWCLDSQLFMYWADCYSFKMFKRIWWCESDQHTCGEPRPWWRRFCMIVSLILNRPWYLWSPDYYKLSSLWKIDNKKRQKEIQIDEE